MREEGFFTQPTESSSSLEERQKLGDFSHAIDDQGRFIFEDVNIGGEIGEEDFRDFIVNRERVGVRTDATLVLPSETKFSVLNDGALEFVLPRSKQHGIIFKRGETIFAIPKN